MVILLFFLRVVNACLIFKMQCGKWALLNDNNKYII